MMYDMESLPRTIQNDDDLAIYREELAELMLMKERTEAQEEEIQFLADLIEAYEDIHHPFIISRALAPLLRG